MNIDFVSDLHMEINFNILDRVKMLPGTTEDILVLGGDTLCYRYFDPNRTDRESRKTKTRVQKFLNEKCHRYSKIVFIPGNHEYYQFYLNGADEWFQDKISMLDRRVVVMNPSHFVHEKFVLGAATFWTSFSSPDDPYQSMIKRSVMEGMNDYRVIRKEKDQNERLGRITADTTEAIHHKSFQYIKELNDNHDPKRKLIIFTHHGPSMMSHSTRRHGDGDLRFGYLSEYGDWIADSKIDYWVHGHTHDNVDYKINNTVVTSAMYGYEMYDPGTNPRTFRMGRITL